MVFIHIDVIIKLLNELVFRRVNEHVVPLGVSRNIMNTSNNQLDVSAHNAPLSEES